MPENNIIKGTYNNLSELTTNLRKWHEYKLRIKDTTGYIYIDNILKYKFGGNFTSGKIRLISFSGRGLSYLDYIILKNHRRDTILYRDFEKTDSAIY